MDIREHKLWKLLKQKTWKQDSDTASEFEVDVWKVCEFGINLSKTIRDTFPAYTLHDESHIGNVLDNMLELLGNRKDELTRDECAMLLMAACCHDIGMSTTEKEKEYLRSCPDCMQVYLNRHPSDYINAYQNDFGREAVITDAILQHYIRSNHHKRINEHLQLIDWPKSLGRSISIDELIAVCQSHGEDTDSVLLLQSKYSSSDLDICLCAVLLRLGDILDFDFTRAPNTLYSYIDFEHLESEEYKKSHLEWRKHLSSGGFTFKQNEQRTLLYRANCPNIQVEKAITAYLDWVDEELTACGKMIRFMEVHWHSLILPGKVERRITATGYLSGDYKMTLNQEKMIEFLISNGLNRNPTVFVKELIQNAINAIRARMQLDRHLSHDWKPQISISTWAEGECFWFRIEDNGIGMTEQTIREYFLGVGSSYYDSQQFVMDSAASKGNLIWKSDRYYGIGILSCFVSDPENNHLELTTKHFRDGNEAYPAYRLSMHGINGYYTLSSDKNHRETASVMPDYMDKGQRFIQDSGTIVAVRMNLYQSGSTHNFKEIIQSYVVYPEIPIHYEGPEGSFDFKTYQDFIQGAFSSETDILQPVGIVSISEEQFQKLQGAYPQITWEERPHISGYCLPLEQFTDLPWFKGVTFIAVAKGKGTWSVGEGNQKETKNVRLSLQANSFYEKNDVWMKIFDLPDSVAKKERVSPFSESGYFIGPFSNLMDRKEFPQYQTWFARMFQSDALFRSERNRFINVIDGIYRGEKIVLPFADTIISDTIFVLDESICPLEIGDTQDAIEYKVLEFICHLDMVTDRIQHKLDIQCDPELELVNHTYHLHYLNMCKKTLNDYWKVLRNNPKLSSYVHFNTEFGIMTLEQVALVLQNEQKIIMKEQKERQFLVAILMQQFDLKIYAYEALGTSICITSKSEKISSDLFGEFPPALFLMPYTKEITKLGVREALGASYYPYNAEHRFSKWLIQNRKDLQRSVPGILSAMTGTLQGGGKVMEKINQYLKQLRKIPYLGIEILTDLVADDFYIIN